jgi:hypothetical protein
MQATTPERVPPITPDNIQNLSLHFVPEKTQRTNHIQENKECNIQVKKVSSSGSMRRHPYQNK